MPLYRQSVSFVRLDEDSLAAWREIPAAVASDCMNRAQTMAAVMKPLAPGMRLCAQARTVACMVGDNGPIHAAVRQIEPGHGEALIVAAGGYSDTAVWGGLLTQAAMARGIAGVVVDGAVQVPVECGLPRAGDCGAPSGQPAPDDLHDVVVEGDIGLSADGRPVACSRFMGGREFDILAGDAEVNLTELSDEALLDLVRLDVTRAQP